MSFNVTKVLNAVAAGAMVPCTTLPYKRRTDSTNLIGREFWRDGITVTLPNGDTMSIQRGTGNYCTGRDDPSSRPDPGSYEVAAWDRTGKWYALDDCDQVRGWLGYDDLTEIAHTLVNGDSYPYDVPGWGDDEGDA